MKTLYRIPMVMAFCLISLIMFTGVECDQSDKNLEPEEPEKCGEAVTAGENYSSSGTKPVNPSEHRGNIIDGIVHYYYMTESFQNVCTHEHINATVMFGCECMGAPYDLKLHVVYGLLYETTVTEFEYHSYSGVCYYRADAEVGLKSTFGDGPGWFFLTFDIRFSDLGSWEANDDYLLSQVKYIELSARYKKYKP